MSSCTTFLFLFFGFQVRQVALPGSRGCQQHQSLASMFCQPPIEVTWSHTTCLATNVSSARLSNFMCLFTENPALRLLGHATEGEAFSRMTTVCMLMNCWPLYQTVVLQVWTLIHRCLCTLNTMVQQSRRCNDCTAEVSHQHHCLTLY